MVGTVDRRASKVPALLRDSRLRQVHWRDLIALSPLETLLELAHPLPWLAASLALVALGWWPAALPCSFMFFLTGLRQIHDAYHSALGLPRWANHAVMLVQSVLMMNAMHAVRFNHLRHHRLCLAPGDVEAASAKMTALGALLFGPLFPLRLIATAWRCGDAATRRWVGIELIAMALAGGGVVLLDLWPLQYHLLAMAGGECFTAFFCVWTVHHDCPREGTMARTSRSALANRVFYGMFFHIEHHVFPAVPTCHLPVLARRLDAARPDLARSKVFAVPPLRRLLPI
jgi:fatty acid desaturase